MCLERVCTWNIQITPGAGLQKPFSPFFLLRTITETALGVEEHHSLAVWVGGWRHGTQGFSDGTCCVGHHIVTLYYGQERKWQDNISREISYAKEHLVQCHEHRWHLFPIGQNCREQRGRTHPLLSREKIPTILYTHWRITQAMNSSFCLPLKWSTISVDVFSD